MLAPVAAGVLPVVRRRVHYAEVGRRGGVEELRHLVVGERVGVGRPLGVETGPLGVDAHEPVGGLVADRVAAVDLLELEAPPRPFHFTAEADPAVHRPDLVGLRRRAAEHHLDDGGERLRAQDVRCPLADRRRGGRGGLGEGHAGG
jgi:hypothetical protein